ncbi:MAG: SDR family NAD(P)-dependent oxidoreductase [Bacteroidales bacterium]|nr:SDR family NAD(P)-dependent oxidoreductase [Bacteroidales bacterium]
MRPIAIITGASTGIGKATALALARNNFDVVITGRRSEKLESVEEEVRSKTEADVLSLTFDIRDMEAVELASAQLTGKWENVDVLVNNAGLAAGLSLIHEGSVDDWEQMIDTNIKGLLYITRLITPGMVKREMGHIINIGSIAGKEAYENGNVYNATKFAVDGLTQAMRIDLVEHSIKVTAINPGAVETEFSLVRFKGDQEQADKVYDGFTPLYAEDIAEAILFAVTRPLHVNIDDLLIMPASQARTRKIFRKKP